MNAVKVCVTGANGFLGNHVVRQLLIAGYRVKAFVLKGTSLAALDDLAVEIYEGNLLNQADLKNGLSDCEVLVHTAAMTDVWPTKNPQSWKINYDLVVALAEVVKALNIKKWIHVGTANSFGFGSESHPGDEHTPFQKRKGTFDYILSKQAAQSYLLQQAHRPEPLPVTIVNPTFMIGEGDFKPGSGAMILAVLKRQLPGYASGGRSFAAVKDVAQGIVAAIEKGKIGECYILGGTNLSYQTFFQKVSTIGNVPPIRKKIPAFLAILFASFLQMISLITKKPPRLSVAMAKVAGEKHYYRSQRAQDVLGYQISNIDLAIQEAIEWFYQNRYL